MTPVTLYVNRPWSPVGLGGSYTAMGDQDEKAEVSRRLQALEDTVSTYQPPLPSLGATLDDVERRIQVLEWYVLTYWRDN